MEVSTEGAGYIENDGKTLALVFAIEERDSERLMTSCCWMNSSKEGM